MKGIIAFILTVLIILFFSALTVDSETSQIKAGKILIASRVTYYTLSGSKTKSGNTPSSATAATSRCDLLPLGTKFKVVACEIEAHGKKKWIKLENPRTRVCDDTMKGYWPRHHDDKRRPPALKVDLWCKDPSESIRRINCRRIKIAIVNMSK